MSSFESSSPPLISVALCTYSGEQYLSRQMDSLLAQDYPNLEIVVVDDVSSDGTVALLEAYAKKDSRIKLYKNSKNIGFLRNFERAVSLSSGELIAPSDQDDIWMPDKISRLYEAIGDADLSYCDSEFIDQFGAPMQKRISDLRMMYSGKDPVHFTITNCVSGHALLVRRDLALRASPFPVGFYHDWWLAFWAASGAGVKYVDTALVQYRQHQSAATDLSRSRPKRREKKIVAFESWLAWIHAISKVESPHQAYFLQLDSAFNQWREQLFAPRVAALLFKKRKELGFVGSRYRTFKGGAWMRYFWGLKAKRLVSPSQWE